MALDRPLSTRRCGSAARPRSHCPQGTACSTRRRRRPSCAALTMLRQRANPGVCRGRRSVNGHRLRAGHYLITLRMLDRDGNLLAVAKPVDHGAPMSGRVVPRRGRPPPVVARPPAGDVRALGAAPAALRQLLVGHPDAMGVDRGCGDGVLLILERGADGIQDLDGGRGSLGRSPYPGSRTNVLDMGAGTVAGQLRDTLLSPVRLLE